MDLPCLHLQLPVQAGAKATRAVQGGAQLLNTNWEVRRGIQIRSILALQSFLWFGDTQASCGVALHLSFEAQKKFGDKALHSRLSMAHTDISSHWAAQQGGPPESHDSFGFVPKQPLNNDFCRPWLRNW